MYVERYDELGLVKVLHIIYYILNIIYCIYIMFVERYDELGLVKVLYIIYYILNIIYCI